MPGVRYLYYAGWNQPTDVFDSAGNSCLYGLLCVGVLVVGRLLFRRDRAAWLAAVIVTTLFSFEASVRLLPPAVGIVEAAVLGLVLVAVLYRFGLLALTVASSVNWALFEAPLTLDASRWYF